MLLSPHICKPSVAGADQGDRFASLESALEKLGNQFQFLIDRVESIADLLQSRRKPNYTVGEVAAMVGRTPYTVRRWIADGQLHAIRVAEGGPRGRLLVPLEEVDRLLADGRCIRVADPTLRPYLDRQNGSQPNEDN